MRNPLGFCLADFCAEFFVGSVYAYAHSVVAQFCVQLVRIIHNVRAERNYPDLLRSQPRREVAREMLYQYSRKAFERAERRAVYHYRAVRLVVLPDVRQVKALRKVVVNLHSAKLPLAADNVFYDKVDFRPVESRLTYLLSKRNTEPARGLADCGLALFPVLLVADVFVACGIAQGNSHAVFVHAYRLEHRLYQVQAALYLGVELFGGAEDMGVVLGEAAHARHAVELAGLFPSVNVAEFREPHWKIAVRMRIALEYLHMERAVHGFEQKSLNVARLDFLFKFRDVEVLRRHFRQILPLYNRHELGVFVIREVAARAEEPELSDVGSENLLVALLAQKFENKVLQALAEYRALWLPQNKPLPDPVNYREKPKLLAELAVVAQFRLLHLL